MNSCRLAAAAHCADFFYEEPWLVDKATLQYPEHIPTLVLDVDKVLIGSIGSIGFVISIYVDRLVGLPPGDFEIRT